MTLGVPTDVAEWIAAQTEGTAHTRTEVVLAAVAAHIDDDDVDGGGGLLANTPFAAEYRLRVRDGDADRRALALWIRTDNAALLESLARERGESTSGCVTRCVRIARSATPSTRRRRAGGESR